MERALCRVDTCHGTGVGVEGTAGRAGSWAVTQCGASDDAVELAERMSGQVCGALPVGEKEDIRTT